MESCFFIILLCCRTTTHKVQHAACCCGSNVQLQLLLVRTLNNEQLIIGLSVTALFSSLEATRIDACIGQIHNTLMLQAPSTKHLKSIACLCLVSVHGLRFHWIPIDDTCSVLTMHQSAAISENYYYLAIYKKSTCHRQRLAWSSV